MKLQQTKVKRKEALPPPSPELKRMVEAAILGYKRPQQILGETGALKQLTKAVIKAALNGEQVTLAKINSRLLAEDVELFERRRYNAASTKLLCLLSRF